MIDLRSLIKILEKNKSNFYTGVPDSVLKELSKYLQKKNNKNHIIATNEGSAVSIGIGYYLATKRIPIVYMQNSGLSNAINPLISVANKNVYSIPLILIIGWRGSPLKKDEPQHKEKGKITEELLNLLNIKYTIIRNNNDLKNFDLKIKKAKINNEVVACLIEQDTIKKSLSSKKKDFYKLNKELFYKKLLLNIKKNSKIISSTGYNSRELMYFRKKYRVNSGGDFYMIGGMGHTSSVTLGYSLNSKKQTLCIDGDGSFLMHLGSIKTLGTFAKNNFKYILLNNNIHDSVGDQTTFIDKINLKSLSKSLGFKNYFKISNFKNLNINLKKFLNSKKLSFLEVQISNNKIKDLPRPKDLKKIKRNFMN